MAITLEPINDGESGASVRAKLNALIDGAVAGTLGIITEEDLNDIVDTEAPGTTTGLALEFVLTPEPMLVASWNFNDEDDFLNYDLQLKESTGPWISFPTTSETYQLKNPRLVTLYSARIRAIDKAGNASAFSEIVTITTGKDNIPPATPIGVEGLTGIGTIWLEWIKNTEDDLSHYEVYQSDDGDTPDEDATPFFESAGATFVRTALDPETTFYSWVRAVDTSANRSPWSARVELTTPPDQAISTADLIGLIDATSFASSIMTPGLGDTLPATPFTSATPETFYLTTNKTIYQQKADGSGWIKSTDASLIVGQLVAGQIAASAIGTVQLAAKAITSDKMLIGNSDNMVPNPSFMTGTLDNWFVAAGTVAVTSGSALSAPTINVGRMSPNGSVVSILAGAETYTSGSGGIQVSPGEQYLLTVDTIASSSGISGAVRLYAYMVKTDGTFVNTENVLIPATSSWRTDSVDVEIPDGVCQLFWYLYWADSASASLYFTNARIIRRNTGELIVDGAVKARHLITDEAVITGSAQIASAVINDAHILTLNAAKIIAGSQLSGSITVSGRTINTLTDTQIMFDDLSRGAWANLGSGTFSQSNIGDDGASAGYAIVANADGAQYLVGADRIPFDPTKLYKVTFRVRRWTGSGSGVMYLGIYALASDGTTFVGTGGVGSGSANYVAASNVLQAAVSGLWTDYVGYVKGNAATGTSNGTAAIPAQLHTAARFMKALAYFNVGSSSHVMRLDSVKIETVDEAVTDLVNAGLTKIDPGKILVSGGTTLADWRYGGDNTLINGGVIAANTLLANVGVFGLRGLTIEGLQFEHNSPSTNKISWTSGSITYTADSGTVTSKTISASNATWSSGTIYIYYTQGATALSATTSAATAKGSNNVVLATYRGGSDMVADGRTVIDGANIKTGTITAAQADITSFRSNILVANSITGVMVQANTLGASRLLIGGANNIISFDPYFQDTTAWNDANWLVVASGTGYGSGKVLYTTAKTTKYWDDNKWAVTPGKDYTISAIIYQSLTTARCYGVWRFFDYAGNVITGVAASGWPSQNNASGNYYHPANTPGTGNYVQYDLTIGPNGTAAIPASARYCSFGILSDSSTVGAQTNIARAWMVEQTDGSVIVKGTVTADRLNVTDLSAISANLGSILVGNANIATAAITSHKAQSLEVRT